MQLRLVYFLHCISRRKMVCSQALMPLDATAEALSFTLFAALPPVFGVAFWLFTRVARRGEIKPPWLRLALGNALALAFLISLAFLAIESYYRFVYDATDSFNYTLTSQKWFKRHFHRNNFVTRDNINYRLRIAPAHRRITFLGDSFTTGHGVANVDDRFANLIRAAVPGLEVQSLAENGYDTSQELLVTRLAVQKGYQFDTVMLVYCLNDISDILPGWGTVIDRIYSDRLQLGWLAANSYFVNRLYYHWKARRDEDIRNYFQGVHGAYQGPVWERQKQRLAQLNTTVRGAGGQMVVAIFPFLHDIGPNYEWKDVHARLAAFWAEQRVPCLDLLPVLEKYPPHELTVNRFDAHPNRLAHALAAEAILKFLATQGGLGELPKGR